MKQPNVVQNFGLATCQDLGFRGHGGSGSSAPSISLHVKSASRPHHPTPPPLPAPRQPTPGPRPGLLLGLSSRSTFYFDIFLTLFSPTSPRTCLWLGYPLNSLHLSPYATVLTHLYCFGFVGTTDEITRKKSADFTTSRAEPLSGFSMSEISFNASNL